MVADHYFSEDPTSEFNPKEITVTIAGREATLQTAGGVFSPDRIDTGTSVLLAHLNEAPPSGNLLDVGCGWGPIALSLALQSPKATVWAVDVNQRALDLTAENASRLGLKNVRVAKPEDLPSELLFQGIWSNPPIRVGKEELHGLLLKWLPRLAADGESYLVVQKNLGADSLHRWLEGQLPESFVVRRFDTAKQFRVLMVKNRG